MKVCLVSTALHPVPPPGDGGSERQVALHARALARRGHDVHVLAVGDGPAALDGVELHLLGRPLEGRERLGPFAFVAEQLRFGRAARRRLRALAPDVAHWHARYPCAVGADPGAPWPELYHAHNWKRAEQMRHGAGARRAANWSGHHADARVARRVAHVIAVSRFLADRIRATTSLGPDRVDSVANVLEAAHYRAPEDVVREARQVLFVGRLAAEKGVLPLLGAFERVLARRPDARLVLAGPAAAGTERGAYLERCLARAATGPLAGRVEHVGEVRHDELARRYAAARVVVVPSIWEEPSGLVALEALAAGVPVVASRAGGLPEAVEHGRTGLLVPPGDEAALAAAVVRALDDDDLAASASTEGPRRVLEAHAPETAARALEACYERLVATRGRR